MKLNPVKIYNTYISFDLYLSDINFIYKEIKDKLYCDNLMSFDIEVSTLFHHQSNDEWEGYDKENKDLYDDYNSLCYCWSFAIESNNQINRFFGRTLESYFQFIEDIRSILPLNCELLIYVHNLKYEFQFLRNLYDDIEVFARETRTPIYCRMPLHHCEYRCSYMLTNLSLENWAKSKNLTHQKMIGDLDYYKIRTPLTDMSTEEINYSLEDTVIVVEGLQEYKKIYGSVQNIPLTQTGRVRREVEKLMYKEKRWHQKMYSAYTKNMKEYIEQVSVFWGGLTRANRLHAGIIINNLYSRDKTSAYPWHLISKQYPVTDFVKTDRYDYIIGNNNFCYYTTVELYDIESKFWNSYIPIDKCLAIQGVKADNGRVISADYIKIRVLDIDLNIIKNSYDIKGGIIYLDMYYALKGYLNNELRKYVLTLYNNKTLYKDVEGKEELYQRSKEMLNSLYGMMVTKVFNNDIFYAENDWQCKKLDAQMYYDKLDNILNKSYKINFTFMQGCYVTAYQRRSLWSVVQKFDEYIVYMDTDSHKYISTPKIEEYYNSYNERIKNQYDNLALSIGVNIEMFMPTSPSGKVSYLGTYDAEKPYAEFKTLGAKRYAYKYEGEEECHCTVSGVNKKLGGLALRGDLHNFEEGFVFDIEYAKKLAMHYLDNQNEVWYNKGKDDQWLSTYQFGIGSEPVGYTIDLHGYKELLLEVMRNSSRFTKL